MTATGRNLITGKYINKNDSNGVIHDGTFKDLAEGIQIAMNHYKEGRKILWFAPTATGTDGCISMRNHFKKNGAHSYALTRETFETSFHQARDAQNSIIVTTNISECGANFNAQVVIDVGRQLSPMQHPQGGIRLRLRATTTSAATQRRGRIGRTAGEENWYYTMNPNAIRTDEDPLIEAESDDLVAHVTSAIYGVHALGMVFGTEHIPSLKQAKVLMQSDGRLEKEGEKIKSNYIAYLKQHYGHDYIPGEISKHSDLDVRAEYFHEVMNSYFTYDVNKATLVVYHKLGLTHYGFVPDIDNTSGKENIDMLHV